METKAIVLDYVKNQVMTDNLLLLAQDTAFYSKLQLFQSIKGVSDKKFLIKKRDVWGQSVNYVPVRYMERILNYIFNFQWKAEMLDHWFDKEVNSHWKTIYHAWVCYRFAYFINGIEYFKDVFWSWQMYHNPATSKFAVLKACQSQAIKNFGQIMGIGSDLNEDFEEDRYEVAIETTKQKKVYSQRMLSNFIKEAQTMGKPEIVQRALKIQKEFEIPDDIREKLDLFLKDLERWQK